MGRCEVLIVRRRPDRAGAGAVADAHGRARAHHRQDRSAGNHLAGAGRAGPDARTVSAAGSDGCRARARSPRSRHQSVGPRASAPRGSPFETIAAGLTPYGSVHLSAGPARAAADRAARGGGGQRRTQHRAGAVQRRCGDRCSATLRRPDGQEESCESAYLAGCDGARSVVRQGIGGGISRGHLRAVVLRRRCRAAGPALDGELHVDLDEADFLAVFPLRAQRPGATGRHGTRRSCRASRHSAVRGCERARHRKPQGRSPRR